MPSNWTAAALLLSLPLLVAPAARAGQGNGLPPGPRFMLNVIAFDPGHCPSGDFTGSNRHMIAVQANFTPDGSGDLKAKQSGKSKLEIIRENTIDLEQGDDFRVLDGNACDKGSAVFQLPADPFVCDVDGDGLIDEDAVNDPSCVGEDLRFQAYRVFIRLRGKPNTGVGITTCATENGIDLDGDGVVDDTVLCSTESVVKVREKGPRFDDVTRELLTICLDTDGDGACDTRFALFDSALANEFWQWNTNGKAHAQLVFIPQPD